ncbi:MAG: hypothetical protein N2110_06155 [Flavobacteriales bacterium]|nr:hypothetical protein [Flavobacteriales bacterium]MCX7768588.1 hypothetical protein [Flavobacteriales bacterium]MDW8409758.1 hypothetical protein [Flavobacteriales bacterium]
MESLRRILCVGLSLLTLIAQSGYTLTLCHCRLEGHFHVALGGVDGDCCFQSPLSAAEGCTSSKDTEAACCKTSQTQGPCCEHTLLRFQKTDLAFERGSRPAENIPKFLKFLDQASFPADPMGYAKGPDALGGVLRPLRLPDEVKVQSSGASQLCVWRN